jgi:hypothetical protein
MGVDMGMKLPFPKGVLSGMQSIAKQSGGFKENLIPLMKEKGYDAINYPQSPGDLRLPLSQHNSFMAFNPGQVTPRLSPQGQELIKARGILEPSKELLLDDATRYWANLSGKLRAQIEDVMINNSLQHYSEKDRLEIIKAMTRAKGGKL